VRLYSGQVLEPGLALVWRTLFAYLGDPRPAQAPDGRRAGVVNEMSTRVTEERHGFPGALRAWGVWGGHFGAPHVTR